MPRFPLVGPSYSDQSPNSDNQTTMNWYCEAVESGDGNAKIILLPTPGLKKFVALSVTLAIAKSHSGNFTQGQAGATFQAVVTNNGELPTSGLVTVTENPPAGLTFVSMSGTGWSVVGNVATRSDALAPGASYPALTITVNVASNATSPQVNQVCVSGGGLSAPDCASDTAIILAPMGIPKQIPIANGEACFDTSPTILKMNFFGTHLQVGELILMNVMLANLTAYPVLTSISDPNANTWHALAGPFNYFDSVNNVFFTTQVMYALSNHVITSSAYPITINVSESLNAFGGEITATAWSHVGAPISSASHIAAVSDHSIPLSLATTGPSVVMALMSGCTVAGSLVAPVASGFWFSYFSGLGADQLTWAPSSVLGGADVTAPPGTYSPTIPLVVNPGANFRGGVGVIANFQIL